MQLNPYKNIKLWLLGTRTGDIRPQYYKAMPLQGRSKVTLLQSKTTVKTMQGHCRATARPLQGHCKATARPLQGHCKATARPLQGHCKATTRLLQGFQKSHKYCLQKSSKDNYKAVEWIRFARFYRVYWNFPRFLLRSNQAGEKSGMISKSCKNRAHPSRSYVFYLYRSQISTTALLFSVLVFPSCFQYKMYGKNLLIKFIFQIFEVAQ